LRTHLPFIVYLLLTNCKLNNGQYDNNDEENDNQRRSSADSKVIKCHFENPIHNSVRRIERTALGHNINRLEHLHRRNKVGNNQKQSRRRQQRQCDLEKLFYLIRTVNT